MVDAAAGKFKENREHSARLGYAKAKHCHCENANKSMSERKPVGHDSIIEYPLNIRNFGHVADMAHYFDGLSRGTIHTWQRKRHPSRKYRCHKENGIHNHKKNDWIGNLGSYSLKQTLI